MDSAAEWATLSPHVPRLHPDEPPLDVRSVSNLTRAQRVAAMDSAAPALGGRRQWLGYACETTGYRSVELSGSSARRVTLVRPGDPDALRRHHRQVRAGSLGPGWLRRPLGPDRVHELDLPELHRTRADAPGSWLRLAQAVARVCGTDDEVALLAGGPLRRILWSSRERLDSPHVVHALLELHRAAHELAAERTAYRHALERMVRRDRPDVRPDTVDDLTLHELEAIRLEARTLSAVRAEWDGVA